jgi:O-antigen/teichoic acid export membrane protein
VSHKQSLARTKALGRGILRMTSGAMLARLIGLFSLPVLTRIYSPEDYGLLALCMAIGLMAAPAAGLGYYLAIPIPRVEKHAFQLAAISLISTLVLTSFCLTFFFLIFGTRDPAWTFVALAAGSFVLAVVCTEILTMLALRRKDYGSIGASQFAKAATGEGAKVSLGLLTAGATTLIAGQLLGYVAGFWWLGRLSAARQGLKAALSAPLRLKTTMKLYRGHLLYRMPAQLFASYGVQAPVLIVSAMYAPAAVGQVSLAIMSLSLPVNLIGQSLNRALYAELASVQHERRGSEAALAAVKYVLLRAAAIGAPCAIYLWFFAEQTFVLFFGDEWRLAGQLSSALSVYLFFQFVAYPALVILNFSGGQAAFLKIHLQRAAISTGLLVGGALAGQSVLITLQLFSWGLALHYAVTIAIIWFYRFKTSLASGEW